MNNNKTCDFTAKEAMDWIVENNSGKVRYLANSNLFGCGIEGLITSLSYDELILPDGWYHSPKNGITNKHHSSTGLYACIPLYKE